MIQPVEWHLKKVEVEVEVDEKMKLLKESNEDIIKNKDYNSNGNVTFKGTRRATEPILISEIGAEKSTNNKTLSQSYKELQVGANRKSVQILNGNNLDVAISC